METDARLQSLFLPILHGPQQGSPPSKFPSQIPHRGRRPNYRAPFSHLSKSPVDEQPNKFPNGAPTETDACLQSLFQGKFYLYLTFNLFKATVNKTLLKKTAFVFDVV
jgi:hypothetical protein